MFARIKIIKTIYLSLFAALALGTIVSCSSGPVGKYSDQDELLEVYLSDYKSSVLEIAFERGHIAHRIVAYHKEPFCQLEIFRDKQVYKNLKLGDQEFREILSKGLKAAGALYLKPANKVESPCRTPFIIAVKKEGESFSVQGCRASDESTVFSKLVSEIEHLAVGSQF